MSVSVSTYMISQIVVVVIIYLFDEHDNLKLQRLIHLNERTRAQIFSIDWTRHKCVPPDRTPA